MADAPEAWLDWALVMNEKYPLGSLKFQRAEERRERLQSLQSNVGWANVLTGAALERFLARLRPKAPRTSRRLMNRASQGTHDASD